MVIPPLKGCDKLRLELKLPEVVASVIIERDRERKLFVSLLPIVSRIKYAGQVVKTMSKKIGIAHL